MGFLLVVLSFIVAEEVVELEPVKVSPTNEYGCNALTSVGDCNNDPYCYWASAATSHKCIDDPCLRYNANPDELCSEGFSLDGGVGMISCAKRTLTDPNFGRHDCSGNAGSGSVCGQNALDKTNLYTYCIYTQLKDGSCPDSICMGKIGSTEKKKHCVKNSEWGSATTPCKGLTETDCKLIPKCLWSSGSCGIDVCFQKKPSYLACSGLTGNPLWQEGSVTFSNGTCVDWHPLSRADGSVLDYCIHKDNANANICYFGNKNITSAEANDFPYDWSRKWDSGGVDNGTYPTYNYLTGADEANPVCETDGLAQCEGHGDCKTIVNLKGAFAGKYCTDGKHAAANILRIPSLLVFLVVLGAVFSL